jgi:regulator of RNase E activity RraB
VPSGSIFIKYEDLNNEKTNKRKKYLLDLMKECGLSYDNSGKTFIKPNGEECSELDYFLHTINYKFCTKKEVLNNTITWLPFDGR